MPYAKNRPVPTIKDPVKGYSDGAAYLAAAIVEKAVHDWRSPVAGDYYDSVCAGDELLGFERCPYFVQCYDAGGWSRKITAQFKRCSKRSETLRSELKGFFASGWFELLCGNVDPDIVRRAVGATEVTEKSFTSRRDAENAEEKRDLAKQRTGVTEVTEVIETQDVWRDFFRKRGELERIIHS